MLRVASDTGHSHEYHPVADRGVPHGSAEPVKVLSATGDRVAASGRTIPNTEELAWLDQAYADGLQELNAKRAPHPVLADVLKNVERHGLGRNLDNLTVGDPEAVKYLTEAAHGNSTAALCLGYLHMTGRSGLPTNEADVEAVKCFRKAEKQGNVDGVLALGVMHYSGRGGLPKNVAKATEYFTTAADRDSAAAGSNLGHIYLNGIGGIPKNEVKALAYAQKAAEQGDAPAQYYLGLIYLQGQGGLRQDDAKAFDYFAKAAEQGEPHAQYYLGYMHECGRGAAPKSDALAFEWYTKSAAQGLKCADEAFQRLLKANKSSWN